MKKDFIKLLEEDIEKLHLTKHPFYKLWDKGELNLRALQAYTKQYYAFVAEFPRLVSKVHSNTPDMKDRLLILDNLNEEEDKNLPHEELWLRFADGIGVSRKNIRTKLLPETRRLVETLRKVCSRELTEGSAALLAYEAQIPQIAKIKKEGLRKFYNLTSKRALEFFEVHEVTDIEHQKTWKKLIKKHTKTKEQKEKTQKALNTSLRVMWGMLTGVYQKYC